MSVHSSRAFDSKLINANANKEGFSRSNAAKYRLAAPLLALLILGGCANGGGYTSGAQFMGDSAPHPWFVDDAGSAAP